MYFYSIFPIYSYIFLLNSLEFNRGGAGRIVWRKFLRRSDLKQPQVPETRLKIDFDRFFRFISGRNFIENR